MRAKGNKDYRDRGDRGVQGRGVRDDRGGGPPRDPRSKIGGGRGRGHHRGRGLGWIQAVRGSGRPPDFEPISSPTNDRYPRRLPDFSNDTFSFESHNHRSHTYRRPNYLQQWNSFHYVAPDMPNSSRFGIHSSKRSQDEMAIQKSNLLQEASESIAVKPCKPSVGFIDDSLKETIDTVKQKLRNRKLSDGNQQDEDLVINNSADGDSSVVKNSDKKRIEHTKMSPKTKILKKNSKKSNTAEQNANTPIGIPKLKINRAIEKKLLHQLFKLDHNKLRQILSQPESSAKYNFALTTLLKDNQNKLSNKLRSAAEKSLKHHNVSANTAQGEKVVQDIFMGHLETMLDSNFSINLADLEPQFIKELSNILMNYGNEDDSIHQLATAIQDDYFNELESEMKPNLQDMADNFNVNWDVHSIYPVESNPITEKLPEYCVSPISQFHHVENLNEIDEKFSIENKNLPSENDCIHNNSFSESLNSEEPNCSTEKQFNIKVKPLPQLMGNVNIIDNISSISELRANPMKSFDHDTNLKKSPIHRKVLKRKDKMSSLNKKTLNKVNTEYKDNAEIEHESLVYPYTSEIIKSSPIEEEMKDASTQISINFSSIGTQYEPIKTIDSECQTDVMEEYSNVNFSPILENNENINLQRMKKIDEDIQKLLKLKFELYNSIKNDKANQSKNVKSPTVATRRKTKSNMEEISKKISKENAIKMTSTAKNKFYSISQDGELVSHEISENDESSSEDDIEAHIPLNVSYDVANQKIMEPIVMLYDVALSKPTMFTAECICISMDGQDDDSISVIHHFKNTILAASTKGKLYKYSTVDGTLIDSVKCSDGAITCMHVNEDNDTIYLGCLNGNLHFVKFNRFTAHYSTSLASPILCMCCAWSTIFIGTKCGVIVQYDLKKSKIKYARKFTEQSILALNALKEGPRQVLMVAPQDQNVIIKDAISAQYLRALSSDSNKTVHSILFHEGHVFCGMNDFNIEVFDFVTGKMTNCHLSGKETVCLQIYKGFLFAGCRDGFIYLFKLGVEQPIARIPGPGTNLLAMEIENGKIASAYKDKFLIVWEIPQKIMVKMKYPMLRI